MFTLYPHVSRLFSLQPSTSTNKYYLHRVRPLTLRASADAQCCSSDASFALTPTCATPDHCITPSNGFSHASAFFPTELLYCAAMQDLEVSFSPEIGDATVGSLTVCTSKDSSLDGPGYLAGLVKEVTYVNEVSYTPPCISAL